MDKKHVDEVCARALVAYGAADFRAELLAGRALVLARHMGAPTPGERGWINQLKEASGLAADTIERCMSGTGSDASYDTLAEGVGMTLGALDREARALLAVHFLRVERKKGLTSSAK